jgi:hypothetical protein
VLGEAPACLQPAAIRAYAAWPDRGGCRRWECDLKEEFERQLGGSWEGLYRDAGNAAYGLCETYPSLVLVPAALPDETIAGCAAFRSKNRLPALTWRSRATGCCIYRCAQPLAGVLGHYSAPDEEVVGAMKADKPLMIFDCRSHTAASANSLQGKGAEDIERYVGCGQTFLDIGNISHGRVCH